MVVWVTMAQLNIHVPEAHMGRIEAEVALASVTDNEVSAVKHYIIPEELRNTQ